MSMSVDTHVDGDPGSCRRAGRQVHHLGVALEEAMAACERQRHLPPAEFGGLSGAAFRVRVTALAQLTSAAGQRCDALSSGLGRLADELAACATQMADARSRAAPVLQVTSGAIHRPARSEGQAAEEAWIEAVRAVAGVRRREAAAQAAWEAVLAAPWQSEHGADDVGRGVHAAGAALGGGPHQPDPSPHHLTGNPVAPSANGPAGAPAGGHHTHRHAHVGAVGWEDLPDAAFGVPTLGIDVVQSLGQSTLGIDQVQSLGQGGHALGIDEVQSLGEGNASGVDVVPGTAVTRTEEVVRWAAS